MAGGALLSASLQDLLYRMASQEVLRFLRGQKFKSTLLRKQTIQMLAFQAVIDDAEAQQFAKPAVRFWVAELKDALYDAEDLLDDITTEALRCKMESDSSIPEQVRNFIQSRVEVITETLDYLAEKKDALGLKQGAVGEILSIRRTKTSLVDESGVCGRQDDINAIVDLLSSSDIGSSGNNKISVISLVGMGGIGKTTLAQVVYKHRRVVDCFDLKAWVCVSEEFDLVNITKTILQGITPEKKKSCDDSDLNLLQCKLEERLSKKKFLLILDDVWNENYNDLEKLQLPFNAGRPGSKVVVTTRSGEVARIMRSVSTHHLGQLPFQDCWSLFAKHAFENGDTSPYRRLEKIGKEIVRKCKGLPLAVKTLGAALYSELEVKQWENILNSKAWDLPNDEILPALRLSYSFLAPQLKRCFAYCSIFPKDYEFEKETLILLWMAEGFLEESNDTRTMEEIGDAYFRDLFTRSFFQKSTLRESYFVMHDLINDLAQLVSMNFSAQLKDGKMNEVENEVRHLSYFQRKYDHFERFETLNDVSGLRTFLPLYLGTLHRLGKVTKRRYPGFSRYILEFNLSNKVCSDILPKLQYLRVLALRCYEITDLPYSIGNLKHLRYLDLTYTAIKRLPDSICCLYNLQTLILYHCTCLVELPQMMSKMISLRHLDIRRSAVKEMPSEMGQLKGLRKLSNYVVGKQSGKSVGELRELQHIGGSLAIQELQNVFDAKDALEANLVGKQHLEELELEWGGVNDQSGAAAVLNNLKPHSELKRLTIHRYGGSRFPDWLGGGGAGSLLNMVTLRLWRCVNVPALPPLGQLPLLEHLYIDELGRIERVGSEFYGTDPSSFLSLKALSFRCMSKWKEWLCSGQLFPCLEKLYVEDCPVLTGDLPVYLPLLTKLRVGGCEQLVTPLPRVPAIRELTTPISHMSWWKELPPLLGTLEIQNLDSLEFLSEKWGVFHGNTSLTDLTLENCDFSKPLHKICLPLTLRSLSVGGKKLEFLLPALSKCHLPFLVLFRIMRGADDSLLSVPLGNFPRLERLFIFRREGLEFLSISIPEGNFPSIEWLSIQSCPNLVSISFKNMKAAASLEILHLRDCPELIFPTQGLPSTLTSLEIFNCNKLITSQMEFCPRGLPSLTHLRIVDILNLKSLDGMGLHLLTSLRKLEIRNCPNLQSLTDEPLPASLSFLRIQDCPLLEDRCRFWTGEYWPLISHIQGIVMNDQAIHPGQFALAITSSGQLKIGTHDIAHIPGLICTQGSAIWAHLSLDISPLPASAIEGALICMLDTAFDQH